MNYARWLPIHLRHMSTLGEKHPQLAHSRDEHLLFTNHRSSAQPSQRGSHWRDRGSFSIEKEDDSWSRRQPARCPVRDSLRSQGDCCTYEPSRADIKSPTCFLERVDTLFQVFTDMGPILVGHKLHCPSQCS